MRVLATIAGGALVCSTLACGEPEEVDELMSTIDRRCSAVKKYNSPSAYAVKKKGLKPNWLDFWDWCGEYYQQTDTTECSYKTWEEKEEECRHDGFDCSWGICSGVGWCPLYYEEWQGVGDYWCVNENNIHCQCDCYGWL